MWDLPTIVAMNNRPTGLNPAVCEHVCSSNCRRDGCNCECGEWHNEREETYRIIRFYAPHRTEANRTILRGLTLQEAQDHCSDPDTREEGEWFDGYEKEV